MGEPRIIPLKPHDDNCSHILKGLANSICTSTLDNTQNALQLNHFRLAAIEL